MHILIPDYQDPTAAPGVTITAVAKFDLVQVGVQDGSGRLVLQIWRDLDSYLASFEPGGPKPLASIEHRPGDGVIPTLAGLMGNPTFAAAWGQVGVILATHAASAISGASVVTP